MIAAFALFVAAALAPADQARAEAIAAELRCVVCQNQSILDSDAEIAAVMRTLVEERIAAGDTDAEVRAYIIDRYGEYVLLSPSKSAKNMMLWAGPALALGFGAIWAFSLFRSSAKPKA
ncbi:MAG: cytochrome c-type biogenesis protein [Pseudomonadota bacterium]